MPMQSRIIKKAPLPEGIVDLLNIASGDDQVIAKMAIATDRSEKFIKQAAIFFIENILLAQGTSSYRVLGTNSKASSRELRRNMALITRFLHPDLDENGDRAIFMTRLTAAWNDLKTPAKREAYDRQHRKAKPVRKSKRSAPPKKTKKSPPNSHKQNSLIPAQPLSPARRGRGAVMRHLTLILMKITGR
ncbi:MAG: J domain-containing protein [Hyphomicrobiaceae bacterium]|nr:J domain-containing protein [Hyphomicrobiaceae bacterium]